MNVPCLSRRSLLRSGINLGIVSVVAPLARLFPEASIAAGREARKSTAATIANLPEDLVLRVIEGRRADRLVAQTLADEDVQALLNVLPAYRPVTDEARVQSGMWQGRRHQAIGISIPLVSDNGGEAAILHIVTDGVPSSVLVEFPNPADRAIHHIYVASAGRAADTEPTITVPAATSCNTDCFLRCLPLYGCSGLALTLCAAALLTCPFFFPTCFMAWACTLYCGGAFAQCSCWCRCTC